MEWVEVVKGKSFNHLQLGRGRLWLGEIVNCFHVRYFEISILLVSNPFWEKNTQNPTIEPSPQDWLPNVDLILLEAAAAMASQTAPQMHGMQMVL